MELNVGAHCSAAGCGQLDFLPFTCHDGCGKVFCRAHRQPDAHACAALAHRDQPPPPCPLCGADVEARAGETPDESVSRHLDRGCKPPKRAKLRKGPRCAARGCRRRELTPIVCGGCGKSHCLQHRLAEDHACSLAPAPAPVAAVKSAVRAAVRPCAAQARPRGGRLAGLSRLVC